MVEFAVQLLVGVGGLWKGGRQSSVRLLADGERVAVVKRDRVCRRERRE